MKKGLIFSLFILFAFCLPVLAAEQKIATETDYMIFKYQAYDQAKIGDKIFVLEVYGKKSGEKITREEYIFQGLTPEGIYLTRELKGTAMQTVTDEYVKMNKDNQGNYEIICTKDKKIVLTLRGTEKKLYLFSIKE